MYAGAYGHRVTFAFGLGSTCRMHSDTIFAQAGFSDFLGTGIRSVSLSKIGTRLRYRTLAQLLARVLTLLDVDIDLTFSAELEVQEEEMQRQSFCMHQQALGLL